MQQYANVLEVQTNSKRDTGVNCLTKNSIICALHQILLELYKATAGKGRDKYKIIVGKPKRKLPFEYMEDSIETVYGNTRYDSVD
jgi:hypothetical protein